MQRFAAVAKLSGKSDLEIGQIAISTQERELHDGFVEVPHRIHVASKDDGVVDLANMPERLHDGSY